jgi:FKBP-type peptidyl-prolyl cis-trans isomerase FkpA
MHKVSTAAALGLCLSAAAAAALAQPALETDQEKTLYALGVALGDNIRQFDLSAAELATVAAGINDAALGNELKVDMEVYGPKIQELVDDRAATRTTAEKEASAAFVYELAQEAGAERSASGMVYVPVTVGTGASPTATDTVRVHYHGTLRDGTVFDSSVERGEPISFPLNGVIPCWTEGVQKMKVGGKAKLACPSDTAYGDVGQDPIPGGAALLFEVELLAIEAAE